MAETELSFSILTPNYNYGRFLGAAIESVAQQHVSAEHVVWDGASTDESVDVLLEKSQELKQLVWRSEPDEGQSDGLNKALALSSGTIIGWLNADDIYLPGALDAVRRIFDEDPGVDVVHGDVIMVDEVGRFVRLWSGYPLAKHVLEWRGCVLPSTASFMRRHLLPNEPWDKQLREVMDWDVFLRLAKDGARFQYLPRPLAAFRLHEAQVTARPGHWNDQERQSVRSRYRISLGPHGYLRQFGHLSHKVRKVAGGAVAREYRTRHMVNHQILDLDSGLLSHESEIALGLSK